LLFAIAVSTALVGFAAADPKAAPVIRGKPMRSKAGLRFRPFHPFLLITASATDFGASV
jgi:hypothetical protein